MRVKINRKLHGSEHTLFFRTEGVFLTVRLVVAQVRAICFENWYIELFAEQIQYREKRIP